MKLGELLAQRAEIQKRMKQVQQRLLDNATKQEGDTPALDPVSLISEYRRLSQDLEVLIQRINDINMRTQIHLRPEVMRLSDAIVRRDRLARHADVLRELTAQAMPHRSRFLRTEIKHVPAFDVAAVMAEADAISRQHREVDTQIQRMNWQVDVD